MNKDRKSDQTDPYVIARKWAMWIHLSSLIWIFFTLLFPLPPLNLIGPFIIWRKKKQDYELVNKHGKEVLNFQLSQTLYLMLGLLILIFMINLCGTIAVSNSNPGNDPKIVFWSTAGTPLFVAMVSYIMMGIKQIETVTLAAKKAKKGLFYRYPFTIRFIK